MNKKSPLDLLRFTLIFSVSVFTAQTYAASDLFMSEYVEGSSNNKAIELYNDTGQSVELSSYELQYYFNGSSTPGHTITLSGTLANGDVYVIAQANASQPLIEQADLLDSASWFNGDDAIVLLNNGGIIDSIGQIGVDPGSQWGTGDTSTQDNTLRRIVCEGDADPYDVFDPAVQWQGYPQDTFDGIGSHTCNGEPPPPPQETYIHEIQGSGASSPLAGQSVVVEAIVIADFQGSSQLNGFFIQEEDSDVDSDPLTSEGIFVYDSGSSIDVNVGDLVQITGTVTEYFDLTEITNVTLQIVSIGNPLPTLTDIELPLPSADYLERYEGMWVHLPQTLSVTENYDLGRYGEVWLSSGGRLMAPTAVALPGTDALAQQAANDLNRILLDDHSNIQNPDPIIYPAPQLTAFNTLRSGDTVAGVTGALSYGFGYYRMQPTQTPNFVADNARTEMPNTVDSQLKVASFNVLNYFNGDGQGGGFPTARGATTLEEFVRQRDKIIAAISAMEADIIGVMEIENDGYGSDSAIADLVNGLNAAAPSGTSYTFINPGVSQIGTDEITVGIIYRVETVSPVGNAAILDSSVDPRFIDTKNRPTLAQTFHALTAEGSLTVAVNHFKSKGSDCNDVGDPDIGDGQGNCNLTRTDAALALVDWLATDPTASNDNDFLIIGDLNSYAMEDPVTAIKAGGYTDLIDSYIGANEAYSYVFTGQSGYLDHALASSELVGQISSVTEWHNNADEPRVLDYNTEFKSAEQINSLYNADPYRASDHDPVIVGINLSPPPATTMHVADLDARIKRLSKHKWKATVTIRVVDNDGGVVEGVTVQGTWSKGKHTLSASCITNINGMCSVTITTRKNHFPRTFTVEALLHDTLTYDPTANNDVDGDSDGTSINLIKKTKHTFKDWLDNLLARYFYKHSS